MSDSKFGDCILCGNRYQNDRIPKYLRDPRLAGLCSGCRKEEHDREERAVNTHAPPEPGMPVYLRLVYSVLAFLTIGMGMCGAYLGFTTAGEAAQKFKKLWNL